MRKLLLVFALLGFVPLACANSVDFDTGTFSSGIFSGSFSTSINVSVTGSLHTIDIQTGTLVQTMIGCPSGSKCFDFSGGSVTVDGTVFKDAINGGITIQGNGVASIIATLMTEPGVANGTASASFNFDDGKLTSGSEDVAFNPIATPEPDSLTLLSAGLIGTGLFAGLKEFRKRKES